MNTDKIYAEQISNNCEDDIDYIDNKNVKNKKYERW